MRILIGPNEPVYHNSAQKQPIKIRLLITKKKLLTNQNAYFDHPRGSNIS